MCLHRAKKQELGFPKMTYCRVIRGIIFERETVDSKRGYASPMHFVNVFVLTEDQARDVVTIEFLLCSFWDPAEGIKPGNN